MNPKHAHNNFEKALINAIKYQCKDVIIIGCLFHWKEATRCYMTSKLDANEE